MDSAPSTKKAQLPPTPPGEEPHEFLAKIARGEPVVQRQWEDEIDPHTGKIVGRILVETEIYPDLETRIAAAKACASYFAPRLSAAKDKVTHDAEGSWAEAIAEIAEAAKKLPV